MADERDIVEVLRSWCDAYPEDVFPTPPDDKRAKDSAAADVMRVMALPMFAKCADEIERLRAENDELMAAMWAIRNDLYGEQPAVTSAWSKAHRFVRRAAAPTEETDRQCQQMTPGPWPHTSGQSERCEMLATADGFCDMHAAPTEETET